MLVTVLAGVMIVGLIVLISLIVISFRRDPVPVAPKLPAAITLPEGTLIDTVTAGPGWYMVITKDGRALVYTADGALHSESRLSLP